MTTSTLNGTVSISQRIKAGLVCLLIGVSLVFVAGMSQMSFAHSAAHDTRHAIGFPCH
ncbi:MAG: CbtB-domain containing protein [Alphaproteobacteria bacterium]|nr:CbtB-domain containing protein [Alphaproteobacteria bacterium]